MAGPPPALCHIFAENAAGAGAFSGEKCNFAGMNDRKEREPRPARAYYRQMSDATADELYVRILQKIVVEKRYRDPDYTARQLAAELGTTPRYVAAAVARHTGDNYNAMVNHYRLRDACAQLRQPRYAHFTAEEIGLMSGFSSRQAFYLAFKRAFDVTPLAYRRQHQGGE